MDDSTLFSQLLDLDHLVDRIQYAQHGSTAVNRSNLSTATSALSSALVKVTKLLETAGNTEQRHHAAESLSEIVDRSIPILESHLEIFERGCSNSKRGRSQNSWVHHYQHSREERRICRSIERITTNISSISSLLDVRSTTSPPATGSTFHNHERSTRRDPTPPRGRQRDRGNHGQHVQFKNDPSVSELSGCYSFRAELPAPLTADEEPMIIPANVRAGRVVSVLDDDRATSFGEEIHTDTEGAVSGLNSPQYSPRTSPPPPYASLHDPLTSNGVRDGDVHADSNEWDSDSPGVTAQSFELGESWVNPIIAGLRKVINLKFPTACASTFGDYNRYRQQTLSSPNYKWYLNFRYLSFILQLDLPFQVFLTNIKTYASGPQHGPCNVLAYLFDDCIIFAVNPFCPMLPDPNVPLTDDGEDDRPMILDSGLEVLEDWPIRFEDLTSVRKEGRGSLIIEIARRRDDNVSHISIDETEARNGRVRHVLIFETTCQREEVFEALSPWLMQNDHNDRNSRFDTRSQPHNDFGASESFVSSSWSSSSSRSSSIARTRNISESPERLTRQGRSRSRTQEHDRTANYTYHSRSHAGPSYEQHNSTSATTPRFTSASHGTHVPHPDYRSEREITFGVSRHRSSPGVGIWMTKTKKKRWYWRGQRRGDPIAGDVETEE